MKLYTFWSADTTYITKYKSLKKAQQIGKDNMKWFNEVSLELGDEKNIDKSYFIPEEVFEEDLWMIQKMIKEDVDVFVIDNEVEEFLSNLKDSNK